MSDIEEQIKTLRSQVDNAHKKIARAEAKRDAARDTLEKVLDRLSAQYGVSSLEEGKTLLENLEKDIRFKISNLQEEIRKFE